MKKTMYEVIKITDSHYHINEGNVFMDLLIGEEKAMLIDTGFGFGDLNKMIREITDKPVIAVNTHGHPDHSCGNFQFEEVWINEKDVKNCEMYNAPEARMASRPQEPAEDFPEAEFMKGGCGILRFTTEGQIFDLGGLKLEVVDLPGHTAGSIGFMDREGRRLFAGDAMNRAVFLFQKDSSQSIETYEKTLHKTEALPVDILWLGHGAGPENKADVLPIFLRCAQTVDFDTAFPCGEMLGTEDVRLHVIPEARELIDPDNIMFSVYGKQLFADPRFASIFLSPETAGR